MKTLLTLLFFFFLSPFLFAQSWKADLQKADSLMLKRDFKNAIPIYESVLPQIEKDSTQKSEVYLSARNGMGRSVTFVWEKEKSASFLEENLALCKAFKPNTLLHGTALHLLGTFYHPNLNGNKPALCEKYLKEALKIRKNYWVKKTLILFLL
jgi:hypothetical protein